MRVSQSPYDDAVVKSPFLHQTEKFLLDLVTIHSVLCANEKIGGGGSHVSPISGAVRHSPDRVSSRQQGLENSPLDNGRLPGTHGFLVHLVPTQKRNRTVVLHGRVVYDRQEPGKDPSTQPVLKRIPGPLDVSFIPGVVQPGNPLTQQPGNQYLAHEFGGSLSLEEDRPAVEFDGFGLTQLVQVSDHSPDLFGQLSLTGQVLP